jgi:Polymer-forming cytoskeletal
VQSNGFVFTSMFNVRCSMFDVRFNSFTNMAEGLPLPTPGDRQTIICLHCGKPQEIGRRALTITCKHCNKSLKIEDLAFKAYEARRAIETCGVVTVEKKGNVVSDRIVCGGLIVRGKLRGNITSRGPVLVGPEAEIRGDVTAPTLAVGAGAVLDGQYAIGNHASGAE